MYFLGVLSRVRKCDWLHCSAWAVVVFVLDLAIHEIITVMMITVRCLSSQLRRHTMFPVWVLVYLSLSAHVSF